MGDASSFYAASGKSCFCFCFFFQAEDGIRDLIVTGVQTCALPIFIHPNAGGIDVGNESHFAAVPADRDAQPVQEFGSWTADLHRMGKWLQSCRIDTVVVQATGVYWIPLYDILTEHGIRVVLVNAQHTKNVPGRKSDVQESQWLMKLHTYGLLRDSFRLTENLEGVRTIWRLRDRHVKEAGRAVQHMQKALTKMNIQLANGITAVTG